jgi:acyl-CoA synthetase (AMP-forming)/AMP-acid ligase II
MILTVKSSWVGVQAVRGAKTGFSSPLARGVDRHVRGRARGKVFAAELRDKIGHRGHIVDQFDALSGRPHVLPRSHPVVLTAGAVTDTESLRTELRSKLSPYELPRRIAFVDAIPRHDTGKVDRDAVGRMVAAQ